MLENLIPEQISTLDTINDVECLYMDQDKVAEAEERYMWAERNKSIQRHQKRSSDWEISTRIKTK